MSNQPLFFIVLIICSVSCHRKISPVQELQSIQQDFFGKTQWDTQTRTALFTNLQEGEAPPPPPKDSFLFQKDAFLNMLPDSLLSQELKKSLTQQLSHEAVSIQPSRHTEKGGPIFYFSYPAIDDSGHYLLLLWEGVHRGQGTTYAAIFTRNAGKWDMVWIQKVGEWIE